MICRNNVYSCVADVFNKDIAELNGRLNFNIGNCFHAVHDFLFRESTFRLARNNVMNSAAYLDCRCKASDRVSTFCSRVCVSALAGVACYGNDLAAVIQLDCNFTTLLTTLLLKARLPARVRQDMSSVRRAAMNM